MATTVTWVLDADSRYEISSKDHLIQLMHNGELYTNAGSVPSNFMRSPYIQTVDIDLEHDPNIQPIGLTSNPFTNNSVYDGGNFTISNWGYTDPNYETDSSLCETNVGLFGMIHGSIIKNVHLSGVCYLRGFGTCAGFLIGKLQYSNAYNITVSLSSGSEIVQGTAMDAVMKLGGVIGEMVYNNLYGATLEGELSIRHENSTVQSYVGGVAGYVVFATTVTLLRNLATFTSPLVAREVGGVVGRVYADTISKFMNAMKGDIGGNGGRSGGVIGYLRNDRANAYCDGLVCSMQGNIDCGTAYGGGVIGFFDPGNKGNVAKSFLNYMSGDIRARDITSSTRCGGLIGVCDETFDVATSIVAMNGYTQNTVIGQIQSDPVTFATINTDFGMTFETDNYSTTDAVVGLSTDANYFNLPYIDFTGTDTIGTVYNWEFIYGNETSLDLVPSTLNIVASFMAESGAVGYKITVESTDEGSEVVEVSSGKTDVEYNIQSLKPETEYLVKVYSTADGSVYELRMEATETTKANVASNYNMEDFAKSGGGYDVSNLDSESLKMFYDVANDLLESGESITISVGGRSTRSAKFVKRGETVPIEGVDTLLIPFSADAGSDQEVAITLSDSSSVTLAYDETNETVNIEGSDYAIGDHLVLDGKKLIIQYV